MDEGKEAGTDLTQNLPGGCAVFQKKAVLEVSPRQSSRLLQTERWGRNRGIAMMRKIPKIALLIGALAVAGQASAHGGGGWGGPAVVGAVVGAAVVGSVIANQSRPVYVQQPVYVQPQPVYAAPPPVYYQPQPVYVEGPPVYYRPAPVYYGPPRGYYGPPRHYYYGPGRW
jgi:hypothetical protein